MLTVDALASLLQVESCSQPPALVVKAATLHNGYEMLRVEYLSVSGPVPAYLLLPDGDDVVPGVVVHHQHAGQRHLGKSEVCGLAGDPWQAFGPALARNGVAVLAPDSICFEDRRPHLTGIKADEEADFLYHFNEMAHRLVRGELLVSEVIMDGLAATAVLSSHPRVDAERVGIAGHSYGGNTVILQVPLDRRVAFACASGAACSYSRKFAEGTGLEFSLVIPRFTDVGDVGDVLRLAAPRRFLIASADGDKYAADAHELVEAAGSAWEQGETQLEHQSSGQGHALDQQRFEQIVQWITETAHARVVLAND